MTPKLTQEQREALRLQRGGPLEIKDDETKKVYVIIESDLFDRATHALEEHDTRSAIGAGVKDLEAGRVVPFTEIDAKLRMKLKLPPSES